MKNKTLRGLLLIVLACLIVIPTLNCKKEPDEISVRLKWQITTSSAGDIVAIKKGIFEKNRLDVTLNEGGFNQDPVKLVASGADFIGLEAADRVMLARAEGIPVVCVAMVFQSSPLVFISKEGSGIETPKDFEGRKVGVKLATNAMPMYEALLRKADVDRSTITEIPIQFSLTPFIEDQVEVLPGWINYQPFLLEQQGINCTTIDPRDYGIDVYDMCYFTTEKVIQEHPEIIERYLKSVLEGYQWAFEHKDEALNMVLEYKEGLDSAAQRFLLYENEPFVLSTPDGKIGWMEREKWEATQQVYLDAGMLEKPINLDSLYTNRFLEKIYK